MRPDLNAIDAIGGPSPVDGVVSDNNVPTILARILINRIDTARSGIGGWGQTGDVIADYMDVVAGMNVNALAVVAIRSDAGDGDVFVHQAGI